MKNKKNKKNKESLDEVSTISGNYIRARIFPVTYQFQWNSQGRILYKGMEFPATSTKMRTLFNQPYCTCCGLTGRFWALEKEKPSVNDTISKTYHLNMYGIEPKYGMEVMLTHDHIKPKSTGGSMSLDNAQTMCEFCNNSKGNMANMPDSIVKKISGLLLETAYLKTQPHTKYNYLLSFYYSLLRKKLSFPYSNDSGKWSMAKINFELLKVHIKILFC